MSKYIKIKLENDGGEYTHGILTDEKSIKVLHDAIETAEDTGKDIPSCIDYVDEDDNDEQLCGYDNCDIYQVFGPDCSDLTVTVEEYSDKDFQNLVSEKEIDADELMFFSVANPMPIYDEYPDNALAWGTEKQEKDIIYTAHLILDDAEEFDVNNMFVCVVNLDETNMDAEIIHNVLYIPKEEQIELYTKEFGDYEDSDYFTDCLSELYDVIEDFEIPESIKDFELYNEEILGNETFENNRSVVIDMEHNMLFE